MHEDVALVTRDRSTKYRNAITRGAPQATQVADRWHLLHNLLEMINRHISRRYRAICQLSPFITQGQTSPADALVPKRHYHPGSGRIALQTAREEQRQALFKRVKERQAQGVYTIDIAREVGLTRQQVYRWLKLENLPPDSRGRFKKQCKVVPYADYLLERLAEGCTNQTQLWREIRKQGFTGDRSLVSLWIRQRGLSAAQRRPKERRAPMLRPKPLSWLIFRRDDDLTDEEREVWSWLTKDKQLVELRHLAHQFVHMVCNLKCNQWPHWVERSLKCSVKDLRHFAEGLLKDEAAVREAITQPWSNGQVEGQVNRLKNIKRQMYGRAKFELLRIRVLARDGPPLHYL